MIAIYPLKDIAEIVAGADIADILRRTLEAAGLLPFERGDVLVVTQKIISKAEGRLVALGDVKPSAAARELAVKTRKDPRLVELVLRESDGIVRAVPHVLIARHRLGHVMANAGIDLSNTGAMSGECALLLPEDADNSARRLRAAFGEASDNSPAIVIADSFGRPWRYGVVGVAIGTSGLPALVDRRGDVDRDGRTLAVTQIALGDQIATAAMLVMGEAAESIPAALIRGLRYPAGDTGALVQIRPLAEDLFR